VKVPVRVRLVHRDGRVEWHDAVRARLDGDELVVERTGRTLRFVVADLQEWSVTRAREFAASGIDQEAPA
jgi:hypothetical protein